MNRPSLHYGCKTNRAEVRQGAAVVELAVVSPLLFLLALGTVEYAQVSHTTQVVGHASRRGARLAARNETESVAQVQQFVRDFVTTALSNQVSDSNVSVKVQDIKGTSISDAGLTGMSRGTPLMVEVSMQFSSVRWLDYFAGLHGHTIRMSTVARRE